MKKNIMIFAGLLLIGTIAWLILSHYGSIKSSMAQPAAAGSKPAAPANVGSQPASIADQGKSEADEDAKIEAAERTERLRDRQERIEQANREYNTPITFHGLVLDMHEQPVSSALVEYSSTDGSFVGTRSMQSAVNGRFAISDIRGKYLDIKVSHPDYYELQASRGGFTYAGTGNGSLHAPDPNNPVVFRLRKKGEAAELIRRSDMVLFNAGEKERSFSFFDHSRRRDLPDYVIVRPVDKGRINSRGKHVLDLELSTPGGGIQLRTDKFQFIAPTDDYQSSLIAPPNIGVDLIDFFVRFDSGNYGRFTIAGGAGQYDVESYFNPDRSPNLEYDREKEITVVDTGKMGVDLVYPAKKEEPKKP